MNNKYEKIIKQLKEANFNLEIIDTEKEFKKYFFDCIRNNNKTELDYLKKSLEKNYEKIEEFIKKTYFGYFCFDYFRDEKIELDKRKYILNKIYTKCIIVNDFSNLSFDNDIIDKETLKAIAESLLLVTNQCVKNNYSGSKLVKILSSEYNLNENVILDLEDFYNQNIISLKLDYLIMEINYYSSND